MEKKRDTFAGALKHPTLENHQVGPDGQAGGFRNNQELVDLLALAGATVRLGPPREEDAEKAIIVSGSNLGQIQV